MQPRIAARKSIYARDVLFVWGFFLLRQVDEIGTPGGGACGGTHLVTSLLPPSALPAERPLIIPFLEITAAGTTIQDEVCPPAFDLP